MTTPAAPVRKLIVMLGRDNVPEASVLSEHQARERDGLLAREHAEALLGDALRETFPASDPISITPQKRDAT